MKKTPKKKMAKAGLKQLTLTEPREVKQEFRRAIREQAEIQKLAGQLQRAIIRADQKAANTRAFIAAREAKLSAPNAGH